MAFLLALSVAGPARADLDAARAAATRGDAAYESQDFAEAVEAYREALGLGLDHAVLHYDLGNAHFKRGALGRAIASYERAHRLAPRDAKIRHNLGLARAQIRDRELVTHGTPPPLAPFGWVYGRLSLDEWWGAFACAFALAFGLLAVAPWWSARGRLLRRTAAAAAVVAAVSFGMGAVRYRQEVSREYAVVIVDEVEVRSGPGREYNLAFRVHEGLRVLAAEQRGEWVRIDLGGELVGWLPASQLERL